MCVSFYIIINGADLDKLRACEMEVIQKTAQNFMDITNEEVRSWPTDRK